MLLLFAGTVFLSAALLFLVEPMVAKMVLPLLGGSPAVWNTCMAFYQAALLAGYAYAHVLTSRLQPRRQVLIHGFVLALGGAVLPLSVAAGSLPPTTANPIPWLLGRLALAVGLPFFGLAAGAPVLQKWFADSDNRLARNPYVLYAASNLGSLLALLCYPLWIERYLPLSPGHWFSQNRLWTVGYGLLVLLTAACAWTVWKAPARVATVEPEAAAPAPARRLRLRWIALAFVPSSLMLGVTTYITIDLAAIPLLWIIPLGLYLLSFVLVFAYWPARLHRVVVRLVPLALAIVLVLMLAKVQPPELAGLPPHVVGIALHLAMLFLVSLACHGELARTRPAARYLTAFYLLLAFGGVLGGLFNALVAPLVFSSVAEYPLVLILTAFLLPASRRPGWSAALFSGLAGFLVDLALAALVGAVALWLSHALVESSPEVGWLTVLQGRLAGLVGSELALVVVAFGPLALACCIWPIRPARLGLCLGALALAAACLDGRPNARLVERERDFFGVLAVDRQTDGRTWSLWHGSTLHGQEVRQPGKRSEPLTYFHTTGPAGQVFRTLPQARSRHVAIVGLGAGCLAAYGQPGQRLTFYEIDPAIQRAAERYFTFLRDSRASCDVVLGDARLRLAEAPDGEFGLIVLDAFSSDAVPMHLITREAFELYFRKLTTDGVILINITNRYLDLRPVLGNLAHDLKVVGRYRPDRSALFPGKRPSTWAVLARRSADLGVLPTIPQWQTECLVLGTLGGAAGPAPALWTCFSGPWQGLPTSPGLGVWTDDFSNLWSALRWQH